MTSPELIQRPGDNHFWEITRKDANSFKDWLVERVSAGDLSASTANKKLMHIRKIFNKLIDVDYRDHKNPFNSLSLPETKSKAASFTSEWIKHKVIASGVLDGVNAELSAMIWTCHGLVPV